MPYEVATLLAHVDMRDGRMALFNGDDFLAVSFLISLDFHRYRSRIECSLSSIPVPNWMLPLNDQ